MNVNQLNKFLWVLPPGLANAKIKIRTPLFFGSSYDDHPFYDELQVCHLVIEGWNDKSKEVSDEEGKQNVQEVADKLWLKELERREEENRRELRILDLERQNRQLLAIIDTIRNKVENVK